MTEHLTMMINGPALSAEGLTKRFDDRVAFRDVSFLRGATSSTRWSRSRAGIFAGYLDD
jgi:hypothetical protein